MEDHTVKRIFERLRHAAVIEFSYFNRSHFYEGSTINHCDEGLCFKSDIPFKPGATVLIRVKSFHPNGARNGDCRGLRALTLAEVKWCKELLNETDSVYEIGVRYCTSGVLKKHLLSTLKITLKIAGKKK